MEINVKLDVEGAIARLKRYQAHAIPRATAMAIRTTANQAEREANRLIRKTYNIPEERLSKDITIRIDADGQRAQVVFSRKHPPGLQHYKARQMKTGVSVYVKKGQRKVLKGAFMATMRTGGTGVWVRQGKTRLPIKRLYGPSVGGMIKNVAIQNAVKAKIRERFPINFKREMGRASYRR